MEDVPAALLAGAGCECRRCVGWFYPAQFGILCEGSVTAPGTGEELCGAAGAVVAEQLHAPPSLAPGGSAGAN